MCFVLSSPRVRSSLERERIFLRETIVMNHLKILSSDFFVFCFVFFPMRRLSCTNHARLDVIFVIFHLLKNWKGWNKKHSSQKDRSFRIIEFQLHNNAHFSAAPVVSIKGFNQQLFSHSATRDGKSQNLEPQTRGQKIKAKLKKKKIKTWISITGWKCGKLAWA